MYISLGLVISVFVGVDDGDEGCHILRKREEEIGTVPFQEK